MTTTIRTGAAAPRASSGVVAASDSRAGAKLSKTTRSAIQDGGDQIKAGLKTIMALLDDSGERSTDARSCGCGSGSSHVPAQTVHQGSGEQTATNLEAELARLSEMFPVAEITATIPDEQAGARQLVGINSLQEAATESDQKSVYTYGTALPDDLKQSIIDEVVATLQAGGAADEPVSISLEEWLQNPEYPFEPGASAVFKFDLSPEMLARVKAAALGLDQPAADEPAEEEPVEEEPAAEDVPADGTASATAPDVLAIDASTLALFSAEMVAA